MEKNIRTAAVFHNGRPVGTVELRQSGLMTVVSLRAEWNSPGEILALFVSFGGEAVRLGIPQPENDVLVFSRGFSRLALRGQSMETLENFFLAEPSFRSPSPFGLTLRLDPAAPFPLVHLLPYGDKAEQEGCLFFPIPKFP